MKSKIEKSVRVTLVLDQHEADWLKGLVQNSLGDPDDENNENYNMRQKFWLALGGEVD